MRVGQTSDRLRFVILAFGPATLIASSGCPKPTVREWTVNLVSSCTPTSRPVVVVHPSNDVYGSDRSVVRTVEALSADESVILLVPATGPLDALTSARVQVHHSPFAVLRKAAAGSVIGQVMLFLRLCTTETFRAVLVLRRLRPCLVYVNTVICPQWIFAARVLRVPVITHVREIERGLSKPAQRALLLAPSCSDSLVTNSAATRDWLVESLPGTASKTRTILNGIDRPSAPVPPPDRARLVVVGRLSERKGQHVAVEAFGILSERVPDATLTLVGAEFGDAGRYAERLRARVADLGVSERVSFVGEVADQWPHYDAADVVLVPSLQEPFGNVAVEAGLSARAVIASGVEGLVEIIEHGVTGVLVRPDDPQELATAAISLLSDRTQAAALAQAARARCQRDFSITAYSHAVRQVASESVGTDR